MALTDQAPPRAGEKFPSFGDCFSSSRVYVQGGESIASQDTTTMKLLSYFRCLRLGHQFADSRTRPGHKTCRRCRMRVKAAN